MKLRGLIGGPDGFSLLRREMNSKLGFDVILLRKKEPEKEFGARDKRKPISGDIFEANQRLC